MVPLPFRAGIVGSRRRNSLDDRRQVYVLVDLLRAQHGYTLKLVSGGCPKGADAFCEDAAKAFGVDVVVYHPDLREVSNKHEAVQRYFARNKLIAENCDALFCWVHPDRTGGTENTLTHARALGKPVYIVDEHGNAYLFEDDKACGLPRYQLG